MIGANSNAVSRGLNQVASATNANAVKYAEIDYTNVWNGIDAAYHSNAESQFKYDFTVNPGAAVSQVRIGVTGADTVGINADGGLAIGKNDGSSLVEQAPIIYQWVNGAKQFVSGEYSLLGDNRVGFTVGAYNHDLALVIDPATSTTLSCSPNPSPQNQPVQMTAYVTANGVAVTTGSVYFYNVTGSPIQLGSNYVNAQGNASFSHPGFSAGSYQIQARFVPFPTSGYDPSTSGNVTEIVYSGNRSGSTTTLSSSLNPSSYGQSVTFTASVSGSGATPGGTVAFSVDGVATSTQGLVNGQASWATSSLSAASHTITANYSGDGSYLSSWNSIAQQVSYNSTTGLTATPSLATFNQAITLTATVGTVNGTLPTGTINFIVGGVNLGHANLNGSGVASIQTTLVPVGSQTITATYGGDSHYNGSNGTTTVTVLPANTTTTVGFSPSPSAYGQSVAITATVAPTQFGGTPTGNVTFTANGATLGSAPLVNGQAVLNWSQLGIGNTTVTASYLGTGNFNPSSGSATQTVNKGFPIVTLTASPYPAAYGNTVPFTTNVAGSGVVVPTGMVTFRLDSTILSTVTLSGGSASISDFPLNVGDHPVTAIYNGDGNYNSSSQFLTETINKATPSVSVTSAPSTSTYGDFVTLTANVAGPSGVNAPTGTITFSDGSTTLGTVALSGGSAILHTNGLSGGNRTITATYNGDGNYNVTTGSAPQTVNKANTSLALSGSPSVTTYGDTATFTATVTGIAGANRPTGQVVFSDGATTLGSATLNGSGVASFSTSYIIVGNRTITATYVGDGNYKSSANTTPQTVNKANTTTTLSISPSPSTYGQAVTYTATVTGISTGNAPSGTVTFTAGATTLGTATLSGGRAFVTTSLLAVGNNQTITASYVGDGNYNASAGTSTQTVNKAATGTTTNDSASTANYGQTVEFTATVTGVAGASIPTGTITFSVGSMTLGTVTVDGSGHAVLDTAAVGAGNNRIITATYNGDGNYNTSSGTTILTVYKIGSMIRVSSAPNSSTYGQMVAFTATLSPMMGVTLGSGASLPTGTVDFMAGSVDLGTATIVNGTAVLNSAALGVGYNQTITANYIGDGNYNASTGNGSQTVYKANSSTTLSGSPSTSTYGQSVTFTATVTGVSGAAVPTGTVTFTSGSVQLGTATLNSSGLATLATPLVPGGTQTVSALYTGDGNYNFSNGTTSQTVNRVTSIPSVNSSSSISSYGDPVTFTATVAGVSGAAVPTGNGEFLGRHDEDWRRIFGRQWSSQFHHDESVEPWQSFDYRHLWRGLELHGQHIGGAQY